MFKFSEKLQNSARCPACGQLHEIVQPFDNVQVLICPLISDLIYLNGIVGDLNCRKAVKEKIFGV